MRRLKTEISWLYRLEVMGQQFTLILSAMQPYHHITVVGYASKNIIPDSYCDVEEKISIYHLITLPSYQRYHYN